MKFFDVFKFMLFVSFLAFPVLVYGAGKSVEVNVSDVKVSGYVQVHYISDQEEIDQFRIRRARFKFSGDAGENIHYSLEVSTGKSPGLTKAYIDIDYCSWAKLRFGQFKSPFSHEELTSSKKILTVERSQIVRKIDASEDRGLQVSGKYAFLKYEVGVFNGEGKSNDTNDNKDIAGRVIITTALDGLQFGVSGYRGMVSTAPRLEKNRTGVHVVFDTRSLSLRSEYILGEGNGVNEAEMEGWYVQFAYKLIPSLMAVLKYDTFDPDNDTPDDQTNDTTIGMNWYLNKSTLLKVNYLFRDEESVSIKNNLLATQFQVIF